MNSNNQQQMILNMLSKGDITVETAQELLTIFEENQNHSEDNKIHFSFDTCEPNLDIVEKEGATLMKFIDILTT
jgi:hypothetical protein